MAEDEKRKQQRSIVQSQQHHSQQQTMASSQQQQPSQGINTSQNQNQQQNSQSQVSNRVENPQASDIGKWWPVFGRKNSGSSSTFWLKNPKKLTLDELDMEQEENVFRSKLNQDDTGTGDEVIQSINDGPLSVTLNRISKKTKVSKEYLYSLKGKFLVYYKNKNDTHFKGFIKLGQEIVIEKKNLQGKNGDIYYIEFLKDGNVRKLYSKEQDVVNRLFQAIRGKCIIQNFRDNYKKLEPLGSGSFASVFKVQRIQDGKIFAAKVIKRAKLEENKYKDKFVAMLLNEYRVLSESKHKNIIQMEEIYQDHDQLVYIMEFLVGGEVYSRLRQVKRFSEEVAAEILKNLTEGLLHIHNKKIVHRDLKLENILFVNKTDNDCKLIDFGFAEKINYEKLESRAGTPGFLPPELFKLGPYTEKGDIFSLGVILYCLVSGCSPFKGKTYKDVLENNRRCAISYDQPVWNKISDECKHLIRRMVEVDPKKRYACNDILKSKWMNKYFPNSPQHSQKSLTTNKTGKTNRKKHMRESSLSKNSLLDDDLKKSIGSKASGESVEFNTSTIINMHSDNPKSFYRKSMRSLKSIKSLKSHFSHKTVKSHSSYSSTDSLDAPSSNQDLNKALCDNYKGKNFDNNVAKFKEDINNFCDIDEDESSNLNQKISNLFTPSKKFIHPLTLAASKKSNFQSIQ
ncbi:Serine/Threonine kinase domain protein (macronuclear) [Tetrahymena thermophila SB210]|uniref:Serine/Threonine kinase domain protein n=1 Tax=Tetrahymena thermophila (strain SB210) TaxID=312017 RepID=Q23G44_TETTS|nr:Serine/Threonine kinase domain protein [Tetrahymena thermophila SB210]EAR95416.2 Serine/Threonine kinase domain protein [Tetrahymena thermophila SB210]|eukprot:XP_001015661.2 Serine/Threonine kinase domain protein [Tetrahymena thermophila SB210]